MSLFTGFFIFLSMSAINLYMLYRLIKADQTMTKEDMIKDYHIIEKIPNTAIWIFHENQHFQTLDNKVSNERNHLKYGSEEMSKKQSLKAYLDSSNIFYFILT